MGRSEKEIERSEIETRYQVMSVVVTGAVACWVRQIGWTGYWASPREGVVGLSQDE